MGIYKNTFRAGGLICEMSFDTETHLIGAEWSPQAPTRADATAEFMSEYRRGRDALLAEASAEVGPIAIVEV